MISEAVMLESAEQFPLPPLYISGIKVITQYRSGVAHIAMLKALEIPKISLFAVFVFVPIPP